MPRTKQGKKVLETPQTPTSSESESSSEENSSSDSGSESESEPVQQPMQHKAMKKETSKLKKETSKVKKQETKKKTTVTVNRSKPIKKRNQSYSSYIYKVLKQVCEANGISNKAMGIMNDFMNDIFERLASEAAQLVKKRKSKTLTSRDIKTAVQLIFPGELAKHAVSEGTKAVIAYESSKD